MKYLVNRETKERLNYDSVSPHFNCVGWDVVEADDEGWIRWEGGECPMPDHEIVEVKMAGGGQGLANLLPMFTHRCWEKWNYESDIVAYRPILPAESKPEFELPPQFRRDLFRELKGACAASAQIPALIAEINAMLPEGYEVTRK